MPDALTAAGAAVLLLAIAAIAFYTWFNREPEPTLPMGRGVLSPASGRVAVVLPYHLGQEPPVLPKGAWGRVRLVLSGAPREGWVVAVVMSPLDVHVQRCPVDGEVRSVRHFPGWLRPAVLGTRELRALENERLEVSLHSPEFGPVKVVQVAGIVARRIRCDLEPGQRVARGQRLGKILLGSMVVALLPTRDRGGRRLAPLVGRGDKVIAGETVIARLRPK